MCTVCTDRSVCTVCTYVLTNAPDTLLISTDTHIFDQHGQFQKKRRANFKEKCLRVQPETGLGVAIHIQMPFMMVNVDYCNLLVLEGHLYCPYYFTLGPGAARRGATAVRRGARGRAARTALGHRRRCRGARGRPPWGPGGRGGEGREGRANAIQELFVKYKEKSF